MLVAVQPGEDFASFIGLVLAEYARERERVDEVSLLEAERLAAEQHQRLLPEGQRTEGHHFSWIARPEPARDAAGARRPAAAGGPSGAGPRAEPANPLPGKRHVGLIWWHQDLFRAQAYVYYVFVAAAFRRRGLAREALLEVRSQAARAGCSRLTLNVFAYNTGAIALYEKLGFRPLSMHLSQRIG